MGTPRRSEDPLFMPAPGEQFFPSNPIEDWSASRLHITAELVRLEREREARHTELLRALTDLRTELREDMSELKDDIAEDLKEVREDHKKLVDQHHGLAGDVKGDRGKLFGLGIAIPLFITIILYVIEHFVT